MVTINDLPPHDRAAAITGFVADFLLVATHVLRNPGHDYLPVDYPHPTLVALIESLWNRECPDLEVLDQVCAWINRATTINAEFRPLSPDEQHVQAAAFRLLDAIKETRHA
jgi:hypothetical protein